MRLKPPWSKEDEPARSRDRLAIRRGSFERVATQMHLPRVKRTGRHGLSRAAPAPRDALPLGYNTGQQMHLRGGELSERSEP